MLSHRELRQKFLDFMASKGHSILPSSPVVPKEDPTVLFNTAGMQPLVPYLAGLIEQHPQGTRLANSQKCIRTVDIEEVGDNRHCTFFEMLGSWSIGDYFKKESITWGFEFLTSPQWMNIDPQRLYVTVYKGYGDVLADQEAIEVWKEQFAQVGITADVGVEYDFKHPEQNAANARYIYRITQKSGKDNWWGLPYRGPCGPCSEIYFLLDKNPIDFQTSILPHLTLDQTEQFLDDQVVEIWNHVFMQYEGEWGDNNEPMHLEPLKKNNIDTGMGFERVLAVLNGVDTVYKTDALSPIVDVVESYAKL